VTGQAPDHVFFEELAAGYALDMLEPAEEQRFVHHADQCPRCKQAVTDYQQVTEALADAAPAAEPSAQLAHRILGPPDDHETSPARPDLHRP
jgi:anti-sigma-K factor RskA